MEDRSTVSRRGFLALLAASTAAVAAGPLPLLVPEPAKAETVPSPRITYQGINSISSAVRKFEARCFICANGSRIKIGNLASVELRDDTSFVPTGFSNDFVAWRRHPSTVTVSMYSVDNEVHAFQKLFYGDGHSFIDAYSRMKNYTLEIVAFDNGRQILLSAPMIGMLSYNCDYLPDMQENELISNPLYLSRLSMYGPFESTISGEDYA